MHTPLLSVYGRPVATPFGLLGNNENSLSFALGYTLRESPGLLKRFLSDIGISGLRKTLLRRCSIHLQKRAASDGANGITDIEIRLPEIFHVIIEAKIGLSTPSLDQCLRYVPRFQAFCAPVQKLVALVESGDDSFVRRYRDHAKSLKNKLLAYRWTNFVPHLLRLMRRHDAESAEGRCIRWFYGFLQHDYQMKAYTTEVWIVPVNATKPLWPGGLTFWDTHRQRKVYYTGQHATVRPLYIAFRADGLVKDVYRVLKIDHEVAVVNYVPELAKMGADWPSAPLTVWHLDDPVPLPRPLRTGAGMLQRHVFCDFDTLLQCQTVKEIEQKMRARRRKAE